MAKRGNCHTALAAAFSVGAELSRLGYDVSFTVGNTPKVDLYCGVPNDKPFKVQVKGISNKNGLFVQKKFFDGPARDDLFLVIVLVPPAQAPSKWQFFILSHKEAKTEFEKMPTTKKDGRPYENGAGLNWGSLTPYENHWATFPPMPASASVD